MPTVPVLQNQVRPEAAPNFQQRPLQRTFAQDVGQGVANVGTVLLQVKHEEQQKADAAAVLDATAKLESAATSLLHDPEKGAYSRRGQDAFNLPQQYLPKLDEAASAISTGLKNQRQQFIFRKALTEKKSEVERGLNEFESRARESFYDETENSRLAVSIDSAARGSDDPAKIASELATQRSVINLTAQRKGWDPATSAMKLREVESKTHAAVIGNFLASDRYDAARRYLAANATHMDDGAVETLQRRILTDENIALESVERARKARGEQLSKDGDRLFAQGKLNSAWIEANRKAMDANDYRYFYGLLSGRGANGPSDPILYTELRDRASRGDDVRAEAREAVQRGQIQTSDYDRLVSDVASDRPGWAKRGEQYISLASGVSDLNPDPAGFQRKAAMLRDWSRWVSENPRGEPDADRAAERIVNEYSIVDTSRMTLTKRAPRFLVGTRTAPDIAATEAETYRAFKAGEIDSNEFNRQAQLINEWADVVKHTKGKPNGR